MFLKLLFSIAAQIDVNHNRCNVRLVGILNGDLILMQNGTERKTEYISSADPLSQTIEIRDLDRQSIANASYVTGL